MELEWIKKNWKQKL